MDIIGEQRQLLGSLGGGLQRLNGAHPTGALAVIEFAEIEHLALDDASPAHASILDDALIAMLLAIFLSAANA